MCAAAGRTTLKMHTQDLVDGLGRSHHTLLLWWIMAEEGEGRIQCRKCLGYFKNTEMHVWLADKNNWTWVCTFCRPCEDEGCERCVNKDAAAAGRKA